MDIANLEGFLWDKGNTKKNWNKHRVLDSECEEVFFQQPILIEEDIPHSKNELRFFFYLAKQAANDCCLLYLPSDKI